MSQHAQPNRRKKLFAGGYRQKPKTDPTQETKDKGDAFASNNEGTEIVYGYDGRIEEIVNHAAGFHYEAESPEQLLDLVYGDPKISDLLKPFEEGAITNMRKLTPYKEAGNLGVCIEARQEDNERVVHGGKFAVYAVEKGNGIWSVYRIVDTTEKIPLDTTATLRLDESRAVKKAERAARKGLKLRDKSIVCELAEDEGGYSVQLNAAPGEQVLKPIQRIFLRFVDPKDSDITIPVEVIIDSHGDVVFGRDLNYYLHAKGFLAEPTTGSVEEAVKQLRIFEIDDAIFDTDPRTGKKKLSNSMVEVYYDPKDQGNANSILVANASGFVYELGSVEQAAVMAFYFLNRWVKRHLRTGTPSIKITKASVGLKEMFRQNITDNAAYFPSAGVIGFGIRVRGVAARGRHLLVIPHVIYHEGGHKIDDEIQKAKNKRITGPFINGVGERDGDVDALCFTILDLVEFGAQLGINFTLEYFLNMKGEVGKLAFGEPIRVSDQEWLYPIDESTEEHDIGEKLDALDLHTLRVWVVSEYNKAVTPTMSEAEKQAIFLKVVQQACEAMVAIRKAVISILKENRPTLIDYYRAHKLVALRNYGADVESYFHQGYTVRHGVPDSLSTES